MTWVVDESGQMPLVIGKLRFTGEFGGSDTGLGESYAWKEDANNTNLSNTDASNTETVGPDGLRRAAKGPDGLRRAAKGPDGLRGAAKGPDGLRGAAKVGFAFDEVEIVARVGVGEMP